MTDIAARHLKGLGHLLFSLIAFCFSIAMISSCTSQRTVPGQSPGSNPEKFLLRDEGLSQLSYVNLSNPQNNWYSQYLQEEIFN